MGYVFISYSSLNREQTDKIRGIFNKNGIESWIAPDDIPVGSKYAQVINKAIKNCACLVLVLTKESVRSQWVAKEVERAINYKKPIIPIQLEDVVLTDEFELYISTDQILPITNIVDSDPKVQSLIATVKAYVALSTYDKQTLQKEIIEEAKRAGGINEPVHYIPRSAEKKKFSKKTIITICAIVLLALFVVFLIVALSSSNGDDKNGNGSPDTSSIVQSDTSGDTTDSKPDESTADVSESDTQNVTETTEQPDETVEPGNNQIPDEYQSKVDAIKGYNELALENATLNLKVGESRTPPAAIVWSNIVIYSQDTSIAIGEGSVVKGVSPGETYIIVETEGGRGTAAYRVIVE